MNKLTTYLVSAATGLVLFMAGIALGNVLRDDGPAAEAAPSTAVIGAAAPADPDSGPDGPGQVSLPRPSARRLPAERVVVGGPDGGEDGGLSFAEFDRPVVLGGLYSPPAFDADDPDAPGATQEPPTMPAGLDADGVGVPDPLAPPVVSEEVFELDLEELLGSAPVDDPGTGRLGDPPFRDPCADVDDGDREAAEEACPEGVGGTILLPTGGGDGPPDPLAIMAQFYTSIGVPLDLRCPNLGMGDDGVYRPLFASNNPADFTITYWPNLRPDEVGTIRYRSSDAELERWIERKVEGEPTWANPHTGVHNCPELPRLGAGEYVVAEIHGVDDFGSEAEVVIRFYTDDRMDRPRGRPPVNFTPMPLDSNVGLLTVPYDSRSEFVYATAIPRNGPRASERSCSEIEGDVLDHRHHYDPSLDVLGYTPLAREPSDAGYDERFDHVAVFRLYADEGTRYQLCAWALSPATRSFDRPGVEHRASFLVRSPRHLRVRVYVGGGHADQPLDARSVRVTATNWPNLATNSFPTAPVRATAFMLEEPVLLLDSRGQRVPRSTVFEIRGPTGNSTLLETPTPTRCLGLFGLVSSCPERGSKLYDVPIPGRIAGRGLCGSSFGSCDPPREQTYVGNLRLVIERYSGPGGPPTGDGADGWQIFDHGRFEAGDPAERPTTPQIDSFDSELRSGSAYYDSDIGPWLTMTLRFDRPVRIEATPWNNFEAPCRLPETHTTDRFATGHTVTWRNLCWKGTYSISLLAVDEEGNELDLRTEVDGVRTGHVGWGFVEVPGFPIAEFQVDIAIDRLGDGMRPQHLEVTVGGVSPGTLIAPGHPPMCRTEAVPSSNYSRIVRSDGGRPITWGDEVRLYLDVSGTGDGRWCGLDERFRRLTIVHELRLDELLAGPQSVRHDSALGDVTVTVSGVEPR